MPEPHPTVVDIGLNLTHKSFQRDGDEVVQRALGVGVRQMILTGTTLSGSREAIELARRYPEILFATVGIHPHHAAEITSDDYLQLKELATEPQVVAWGEFGLDFYRHFSPVDQQEKAFRRQLEIASELGLPVFLHQRDAHDRFRSILGESIDQLADAVVHCFTDSREAMEDYLAMGCYIGITGWVCDERRGESLRQLVPLIPSDRLLIETDAPYLLPRDLRPLPKDRRNEPCHLPHVGKTVAALREVPYRVLAAETTANASRVFRLPEAGNGN